MGNSKEIAYKNNEADEQVKSNQLLIEQKRLLELIAKGKSLEECLSSLCEAVPKLNPGVRASVLLADDHREKFNRSIAPDLNPSFTEGLEGTPINDLAIGTCGTAVFKGEPVTCTDIANDEKWSKKWRELCLANEILACHSKPVFDKNGEAIGSFMLCLDEVREPNEWEHRLADFGTHIVSVVLERNRSQKSLWKHKEHLKADLEDSRLLHDISTKLIEEESIEALYEKILDAAVAIMDSDFSSLQMFYPDHGEDGELQLLAYRGFSPKAANFWNMVSSSSKSTCGIALNRKERVMVSDVEECDFLQDSEDFATCREIGIGAMQSTPLISRSGQVLGMISTHWNNTHNPSDRDFRLLDILARQATDIIEQKQDKNALREREELFRAFTTASSDIVYRMSPDWKEMNYLDGRDFVNDTFESNKKWFDNYIHPEDQQRVKDHINEAIRSKSIFELEHRVLSEDDSVGWVSSRAIPITGNDGEIKEWFGAARDISERKEAEEELRQSKEKYHTLFNSIDEGFCIIRMIFDEDDNPIDYKFLEVNPAFEEQTGLKDPVGKKMRSLVPEHEQHWFDIYGKIAKTGEPARFEQSAEGLDRYFNVYAFPFGKEDNNKVAVLFTDINERKKAEKEREKLLREVKNEREHLNNIFQNAPSFMSVLRGPDHVYERANDLYRQLVGDRELVGKTVREALPELEGQRFYKLLDQVYETGKPYIGTDIKVTLQDPDNPEEEHERYLDFVYQPIKNSAGEVTGIFTQGVDLTERKQAKRELQEMNETLEKRVEDRTSSLLAYQKQLRRLATRLSKAEEEERRRLAAELHDNLGQLLAICKMKMDAIEKTGDISDVSNASGLVNDALEYTRQLMSELKPPPSLGEESLAANIEWLAEKMKKHHLDVIFEDKTQDLVNLNDDIQITTFQGVRELLFNIVKHANVDEAFVRLSYEDHQLKVTVEDEGEGFDTDNIDENLPDNGGFGLFNVRERIDLLGGSVEIESAPGEGTKVNIFVPLEDEKPDDQQEFPKEKEEERTKTKNQGKIKVLLVDDHEMMRKGLKRIIESENDLTVIAETSDGENAIQLAQEVMPDIILMDINLPDMNGIDATEKIKSELPEIIVIGLSVYDDKRVADEMRDAGASAYLTKSDAFETLSATIRSEIKAHKS